LAKVVGTEAAYHWSVSKLADFLGMDRKTVSKRIGQSGIPPADQVRGNPVYDARQVVKFMYSPAGSSPGGDLDLDSFPEARKAWYQSELYRVQLEEKLGGLIPESEHARCLAAFCKTVAAALDSIPDILERDANLAPEGLVLVQEVLDGVRNETAAAVSRALESEVDE
tara:strand:- start:681 stop:1184 length:504 start_codon:yes stop_codon:yes gene_type:complete